MRTVTSDFERLVTHLTETGRAHLRSPATDPVAPVRERALAQLREPQFDPEEWTYTDLDSLVGGLARGTIENPPAPQRNGSATEAARARLASRERADMPVAFLSSEPANAEGAGPVQRGGASIYRTGASDTEVPPSIAAQLGSLSAQNNNPLIALNTALFTDAVVVHVPRRTACEGVLRLVHVVSGDSCAFPRTAIIVEEGASVTIVEELVVIGEEGAQNPAVSEIVLGPGAHCSYTRLVDAAPSAEQLSAVFVRADRDAQFRSFFLNTGGALVRNEVYPSLVGPGADVHVSGLALGNKKQRVDTVVSMEHAAPHCESRQLFKGIYADQSAGAFSGTIIVQEGAQKTNAFQSSKSILLSPDASVYTKPQLKIWADDVKCSHGATVGQIDEDALFYLRSRGIPSDAARILLVHAFVGEVLAEIDTPAVRALMSEVVEKRLSELLNTGAN